jgi:4-hydroxy-tetrahydrodipicolinate synthase
MDGIKQVTEKFGISAALALPFDADGAVQHSHLAAHAKWCLAEGCTSVTVFGTTGEGASLGLPARDQIVGALAGAGLMPRSQIIGGITASSQHDAIVQARMILDCDCRALLLAPPFYFKSVSDDGLFSWFAKVIEKLGGQARSVLLYNIPAVTAVPLSLDLIDRLRRAFPDVIEGVKDSSGDIAYSRALLDSHGDLVILIGDERYLAEGVQLGAQGAISGLANLVPGDLHRIVENGAILDHVASMVDAILQHPVVPAVKEMIAQRTGDPIWRNVRPPLVPLPANAARQLTAAWSDIVVAEHI